MKQVSIGIFAGIMAALAMGHVAAQPTPRVQQLFNECVNEAGFTFRQCVWLQGVMSRYGIR